MVGITVALSPIEEDIMRKWSLNVPCELWIDLKDFVADVSIEGGAASGTAEIEIEGDERLLARVDLCHDTPPEIRISYGASPPQIVVGDDSGVRIFSGIRGRNVTIKNVVVNGAVVTTHLGDSDDIVRVERLPTVRITVPEGTILDVRASGSGRLRLAGVKERLRLELSGAYGGSVKDALMPEIRLHGATRMLLEAVGDGYIECSGASNCQARLSRNADGRPVDIRAVASGASQISLRGAFGKTTLEASGVGKVLLTGDCAEVDAEVSGTGSVRVEGKVAGPVHRRSSGLGKINIGS